ncbi:MAG: hypothetical protein ABJ034_10115 [Hyphomicrobiales bacterium]
MGRRKLTIAAAEQALREAHGMITHAARFAGCHYETMRKFVDEHPSLLKLLEEIELEKLDDAEIAVVKLLEENDPATVRWFLGCKGRDRGYGNQTAVTGAGGGPVQHQVSELPKVQSMTNEQLEAYVAYQKAMLSDDKTA